MAAPKSKTKGVNIQGSTAWFLFHGCVFHDRRFREINNTGGGEGYIIRVTLAAFAPSRMEAGGGDPPRHQDPRDGLGWRGNTGYHRADCTHTYALLRLSSAGTRAWPDIFPSELFITSIHRSDRSFHGYIDARKLATVYGYLRIHSTFVITNLPPPRFPLRYTFDRISTNRFHARFLPSLKIIPLRER